MENYSYNKIALDYHLKRKRPWRVLEDFLRYLNEKDYCFDGYCIDLGCGNGRNFKVFKNSNNKLIGIDNSIELLKIARINLNNINQYSKSDTMNIQLILSDINYTPIKAKSLNNIFSIAALHHIKGKEQRQKVILNLQNLINKDDFILLTVWRRWQKTLKNYFITDKLKRIFNLKYRKQQKKVRLKRVWRQICTLDCF